MRSWRRAIIGASWLALAAAASADPVPYDSLQGASAADPLPPTGSQASDLRAALEAAKAGDVTRASALASSLSDPLARRIVTWSEIDNAGTMLNFSTLQAAAADLQGWPRPARRRAALEKALEPSAASPSQVVAFFAGADPTTPQGAMALAAADQALGRPAEAQTVIRRFWRERPFEADQQAQMRQRFSGLISPEDDAVRLELLLYGQQGPAARALLDLVPGDQRALGEARLALRADRSDAPALVDQVPAALKSDPGLAVDRARYLRKRSLDVVALSLLPLFPRTVPDAPEVVNAVWGERRALMNAALRSGDVQSAYASAADAGLPPGLQEAEAEFFAGWIALTRLHDPTLADQHFVKLQAAVTAPISVARALYWRGRAAEMRGDGPAAAGFFAQAGAYYTTFYGQLALEKSGRKVLSLAGDPVPTAADRQAFEALDLVQAARLVEAAGERELFRVFVFAAADRVSSAAAYAQLVDLARSRDQDLSMRVVRIAAQKGYFLPERGYPVLRTPAEPGVAEPAFMLAIARQESNFDPAARSGVGARGLMQLMPGTASILARRLGVGYAPSRLGESDYNLRLGGTYLGDLLTDFGGSYVLAAAGYNAGPSRPPDWISYCGDPRGSSKDPVDFIECIPFSETRNYVMRTLETTQIYRARLNGGSAALTLAEDLKKGSWTAPGPAGLPSNAPPGGPIPYSQMTQSSAIR